MTAQTLDPRLRHLLAYWEDKRQARTMPRRADIDPMELGKKLLPFIALTDVVDGGKRFRFRLCGTGLASLAGLDLTGRYIDELNPNRAYADYISDLYRRAVDRKRPVYSETEYAAARTAPARRTMRLICPLSDDDESVDICIAGQISKDMSWGIAPTLTYADAFKPGITLVL